MEEHDPRDNPSKRVQNILHRTGTVSPWDFSRLTDEAITHASEVARDDAANANLNWRPLGPRNLGGRIRCLAQDERNPQTIYAGSAQGGLWRTLDCGESWTALDDFSSSTSPNSRQSLAIGAIGLSYSNPEIIYIGTGEPTRSASGDVRDIPGNGLFRSTDSGATFARIDHPDPGTGTLGFGQFESIVVDPWQPSRFWIASSDGGMGRGTPPIISGALPTLHQDDVAHLTALRGGPQQATDIMVDFGPVRTTPPNIVTVYVAIWGRGVFRAKYSRSTDEYVITSGAIWTQITPAFSGTYTRIKVAQCRGCPNWIGVVAADSNINSAASNVFISDDRGDNWIDTGARTGDTGAQARYDLMFGMHPTNPSIFAIGVLDVFLGRYDSVTRNTAWTRILNSDRYDLGDRAQHADQHAILFDIANPMRIWVGNDGGVSASSNLGGRWRGRGLGINAAQFNDITTHPTYPYIYAGGLQDNGTWLSYGGQTWFLVNGGDGGGVAFIPNNPRRFFTTWQEGLELISTQSTTGAIGSALYMNRLPDVPQVGNNDVNHRATLVTNFDPPPPSPLHFAAAHSPSFVGVIASHPSRANHVIIGRNGAAYLSINSINFLQVSTDSPVIGVVSDVIYSAQNPDTHWWISTDQGELYFTDDGNNTLFKKLTTGVPVGANITAIAVNPKNDQIVAISVTLRVPVNNSQGRIYLSGDSGQHWLEISGRVGPCSSADENQFNPSTATAILFDPTSSADVTDPQVIFCACFAGVYIIRNAIAPTAPTPPNNTPFEPQWRTFNNSLPLPLVFDLEAVNYTDSAGVAQHLIRCATHARGAYECDLAGVTQVHLLIRDNIVDDGKTYAAAHQVPNNHDPRMTPGPTAVMVLNRSIDIRIDTPAYRFLGSVVDGLEMDEILRSDELAAGILNIVYVQVHNNGFGKTNSAELHLFWAKSPATPPDLQANFWSQFPNVADGGTWQKIDSLAIDFLESGQPRVMAFNWHVPCELTGNIALLAVISDPIHDALDSSTLGNVVDPADIASFIGKERRTALFVSPLIPLPNKYFLRDGFDDTGLFGETAWGTQSHDIIVVQAVAADPVSAFADANDKRTTDILDGSETNHIYVRVHNQCARELNNMQVEVFRIAVSTLQDPNTWVSLGTATLATMASKSFAIFPAITWVSPPDPAPEKRYVLIALIQGDGDARPDFIARVDSIQTFWRLLLEDVDSGNVVVRGLNWQA